MIERWWKADKAEGDDIDGLDLATRIFSYVEQQEIEQSDLYERFFRLDVLYDPYFRLSIYSESSETQDRRVEENVIASGVDTVTGIIATAEVRPRVLLDDASWEESRRAASLSWYAEGIGKQLKLHELGVSGFKDAALKGTGLTKIYVDWTAGEICAERVPIQDIIVPDGECRGGKPPRQLHHRQFLDKEDLIDLFPYKEEEIERAGGGSGDVTNSYASWVGYQPVEADHLVLIESWRLPYGKRGSENYKAGRHTVCIPGCALLDEEYHKPFFPFARMAWTERALGWYAIGGGERIAGHQRRLNKLNWATDRQQDQIANPTTWVKLPDANISVKTTNRFGTIGVYKSEMPKTVIPQAVSGEQYARLTEVKQSAFDEIGVTRMSVSGKKPSRLESGAAMREYRDQSTQRLAPQERNFEQYILDSHWLAIDCARDMALRKGHEPPTVIRKLSRGRKKLTWKDVDVGEVRVQMQAAATLSRTPAGRTQMVLEWAQGGIVSQDEARKLLMPFDPLDLDKAMSLYTAALDDIDMTIEQLLDGEQLMPEPFQNMRLGVWRVQQSYLQARGDDAPEDILDNLRQWSVQAAYILANQAEQQAAMELQQGPAPTSAIAPEAKQIAGIG